MASKFPSLIFLILMFVSITLTLFVLSMNPKRVTNNIFQLDKRKPPWFNVIEKNIEYNKRIKVGVVNINPRLDLDDSIVYGQLEALYPQVEYVSIDFDHVDENLKWKDLFPTWIDEDEKYGHPNCIDLPMPIWESYRDVNVVVAKVPCGKGIKDVFMLQVNLVVANLAVESGWVKKFDSYEPVFVVFIGSCSPMIDIFRCDDLLFHESNEFWVYKPDLVSLRQKMLMPFGTCQLAPSYAEKGKEVWRGSYISQSPTTLKYNYTIHVPKLAYVTVLHTSEAYVCGAIALAQSILRTNKNNTLQFSNISYTRDLILLADKSIGNKSIKGLKSAGWKIKRIQRILNPFAQKGTYNEWNYSKLRIWQLTMYDKIIFLDSDLLVLKNIDHFFSYPQLSAAPNDFTLFNSGLMVIEPSKCMFEELMNKTLKENRKYLVLKEIPEGGVARLVGNKESLASCDIAVFVHDRSDEASWKASSELLERIASHGEETGYEVPCLIVAAKDDLDSFTLAIQDSIRVSQDMGVEAPIPISVKLGDFNSVFRRIVTAAEHPHLSIPETEAGKTRKQFNKLVGRSLMCVSVGAAVALVGLGAYRIYAARKSQSG